MNVFSELSSEKFSDKYPAIDKTIRFLSNLTLERRGSIWPSSDNILSCLKDSGISQEDFLYNINISEIYALFLSHKVYGLLHPDEEVVYEPSDKILEIYNQVAPICCAIGRSANFAELKQGLMTNVTQLANVEGLSSSLSKFMFSLSLLHDNYSHTYGIVQSIYGKKYYALPHEDYVMDKLITDLFEAMDLSEVESLSSIGAMQNLLNDAGLKLAHQRKGEAYLLGSPMMISAMLNHPKERLAAWLVSDKICDEFELKDHFTPLMYDYFTSFANLHDTLSDNTTSSIIDAYDKHMSSSPTLAHIDDTTKALIIDQVLSVLTRYDKAQELSKLTPSADEPSKAKVMFLGDSDTISYGVQDADKRWFNLLVEKQQDAEFINCSMGGLKLSGAEDIVTKELEIYKPDIVYVTLSGNDVYDVEHLNLFDLKDSLCAIAEVCAQRGTKLMWVAGIPNNFSHVDEGTRRQYNNLIDYLNRDPHITALKAPDAILNDQLQEDRLHFTVDIQEALADCIADSLRGPVAEVNQRTGYNVPETDMSGNVVTPLIFSDTNSEEHVKSSASPKI